MKIFILTGELSGETHAAGVLGELLKKSPDLKVKALGSCLLKGFGAELVADYRDYSFSGFTEVVLNINKVLELKKIVMKEIKAFQPDILLLVDFAGFNLEIAKIVKKELKDTKIIEFIAPQIWASRPHRIQKIKGNVDKVLCTLPFEEELYKKADIPVRYVGNPVACSVSPKINKEELFKLIPANDKESNPITIGIFPGSRKSEIKAMLPIMIKAAREIKAKSKHNYRFILAQAPSISTKILLENGLEDILEEGLIDVLKPSMTINNNHKLLSSADLLWLCSGTVTLEAAIYGTPYFLAYKGDWLSYQLYRFFKIIDMAGLANIIAGKYLVPEFLQYDATVENFVKQTQEWINEDSSKDRFTSHYQEIKNNLLSIKGKLTDFNTPEIVASEILEFASKA